MAEKKRCEWCLRDQQYMDYHDSHWGVPVHDDTVHFEYLALEAAQAGLSWYTILKRMPAYKEAFDNWDYKKIANTETKSVRS